MQLLRPCWLLASLICRLAQLLQEHFPPNKKNIRNQHGILEPVVVILLVSLQTMQVNILFIIVVFAQTYMQLYLYLSSLNAYMSCFLVQLDPKGSLVCLERRGMVQQKGPVHNSLMPLDLRRGECSVEVIVPC